MKALILRNDAEAGVATSRALIDKGFQVLCVETQAVAHALIRIDTIDLLVMDERVQGQLTHAIALSGERRNPYLSAILLTDRAGEDTDDLYGLIPALYALAGTASGPDLIARLAMSAVSGQDAIAARVARDAALETQDVEEVEEAVEVTTAGIEPDTPDGVLVLDETFAVPTVLPALRHPPQPLERVEAIVLQQVAAMLGGGDDVMPLVHPAARRHPSRPTPARIAG